MNQEMDLLAQKLDHEFQGVIWFTKIPLNHRPAPFYPLNHLFDGLLIQRLREDEERSKQNEPTNIFTTTLFARPFFLFHAYLEQNFSPALVEKKVKEMGHLFQSQRKIYFIRNRDLPDFNLKKLKQEFGVDFIEDLRLQV